MSTGLVFSAYPSLVSSWPRKLALALLGTMIIALSAKMQIPFWPVPMTMQTFAILCIAMAFGPVLGTGTVLLYLAEGALGLPVFAGTPERGIGLAYMAGPTGGYLVGYAAAAALVGYLAYRNWDRRFVTTFAAMALGTAIIFASGYVWLAYLIGPEKAWTAGVQPFLLGAFLKVSLAALLLPKLWRISK